MNIAPPSLQMLSLNIMAMGEQQSELAGAVNIAPPPMSVATPSLTAQQNKECNQKGAANFSRGPQKSGQQVICD